jgi:peptidyl-prolyl cis-trans isomerase SurA
MIKIPRAIAVISLAAVLAGCNRTSAPAANVWATVNDQSITREDTEKYYRARLAGQAAPPSQDEALSLMLSVLDELINNEVLIQRARQMGLEATDGEVEDKFTEAKSPYTEEEFQRRLKESGMTVDDLRRNIRQQFSVQKLINREILSKIAPTDQDVTNFYNENRTQFNVTEVTYRLSQIVVTPAKDPQVRNRKNDDAGTDIEARRKAAALLQQLRDGADFATLATDYSEEPNSAANGGDVGYWPESQITDPNMRRLLAGMTPGQTSDIIRLPNGYAILRLVAKELPGQRQLTDPQIQQTIRDTLSSRKEQLMRAAYLVSARDQSRIVNYLARQVLESTGKLPEIKIQPPSAPVPGTAPTSGPVTPATPTPVPQPTSAPVPPKAPAQTKP